MADVKGLIECKRITIANPLFLNKCVQLFRNKHVVKSIGRVTQFKRLHGRDVIAITNTLSCINNRLNTTILKQSKLVTRSELI